MKRLELKIDKLQTSSRVILVFPNADEVSVDRVEGAVIEVGTPPLAG